MSRKKFVVTILLAPCIRHLQPTLPYLWPFSGAGQRAKNSNFPRLTFSGRVKTRESPFVTG